MAEHLFGHDHDGAFSLSDGFEAGRFIDRRTDNTELQTLLIANRADHHLAGVNRNHHGDGGQAAGGAQVIPAVQFGQRFLAGG